MIESIRDIGDAARRSAYVLEEIRGGNRDDVVKDTLTWSILLTADVGVAVDREFEDAKGYSIPNSEKYQSRMSLEDISPTEMTGLRRTAAENISGNRPITEIKDKKRTIS